MIRGLLVTLFLALIVGTGVTIFYIQKMANKPIGTPHQEPIIFELKQGQTYKQIIDELDNKNFLAHPMFLKLYGRYKKMGTLIRVGEYRIDPNINSKSFFEIISSGKSIGRKITVPEGYNIYEISRLFEDEGLMAKQDFINYVTNPSTVFNLLNKELPSLEGYLYPETYQITKYSTGQSVIKNMVDRFKSTVETLTKQIEDKKWTLHQIVTLASIIEKETGAHWERGLISSVFHNRLYKHMKLQTDPTILYAKALSSGVYEIKISKADLLNRHPYNTYQIYGLPPGPIANPGLDAIKSAILPETSNYFYFVSKNDGTHTFSADYADHNKAVSKFQRDNKARQGKSWRDLNKKADSP